MSETRTWSISYPADELPSIPLDQVLWQAFEHFAHLDHSNAAIHCAPVRYSPITFRLGEQLDAMGVYPDLSTDAEQLLVQVMRHLGAYAEDKGR